jgi:hypothetical protein
MIRNVGKDISARRVAIADLRTMFNMNPFDETVYADGSIALLKALDKDLALLQERKEKILESQMEVYRELEMLCGRTATEMVEVEGISDKVRKTCQNINTNPFIYLRKINHRLSMRKSWKNYAS